jgi:energy-coupling factor transport system substrate-specific component
MAQRMEASDARPGARARVRWRDMISRRHLLLLLVGAALYGIFGWLTSGLKIPGPFDSQIRPGVSIPLFFGVAFGPVVGFVTGSVGNIIIDALAGTVFWNWSIGNGLMGLVAGFAALRARRAGTPQSLVACVLYSLLGVVVGMAFASVTDLWVRPDIVRSLDDVGNEFFAVTMSNAISAIVLVPLIMLSYQSFTAAENDV